MQKNSAIHHGRTMAQQPPWRLSLAGALCRVLIANVYSRLATDSKSLAVRNSTVPVSDSLPQSVEQPTRFVFSFDRSRMDAAREASVPKNSTLFRSGESYANPNRFPPTSYITEIRRLPYVDRQLDEYIVHREYTPSAAHDLTEDGSLN